MVRTWLRAALVIAAAQMTPPFAHARPLEGDPCSPSGQVVVTDPAGDVANPQLDILDLTIAEHGGGVYAGEFVITLRVQQLDTPNPAPAALWTVSWKGPGPNTQTLLSMSTCSNGAAQFGYTFQDSSGQVFESGTPDTAWFTPDGRIVFVMSRDKLGNPAPGDSLLQITGFSHQANPPDLGCVVVTGPSDAAGTGAYAVGACVLAVRPGAIAPALRIGPPVPSPSSRSVRFVLEVPRELNGQRVAAAVFDVGGRRVRSLGIRAAVAGRSMIEWDLRDDAGGRVVAGSYWIAIQTGNQIQSSRVQVLR
jgi:hypothetical protein